MIVADDDANGTSLSSVLSEKLHEYEVPRVEPLLPEHLDNAFESIEAAFKDDPVTEYIKAGKEMTPSERKTYKRIWKFYNKRLIKRKVAYTVNAGDAVVIVSPPKGDLKKPSPIDHTVDFIIDAIMKGFLWLSSHQEQAKRYKEVETKAKNIVEQELGDSAIWMVYVDLLATKPELQGHGYGTALLNTILFSADMRGRDVYLTASNTTNVPFYESFGFINAAHFSLGEDNPKWDKPPVIVTLMVREARNVH